jgi:hypothetical protein
MSPIGVKLMDYVVPASDCQRVKWVNGLICKATTWRITLFLRTQTTWSLTIRLNLTPMGMSPRNTRVPPARRSSMLPLTATSPASPSSSSLARLRHARAFRLPKEGRVRSFEVDAPKTQAVKRETLKRAGIDSTGVTFVAADFEKEDWLTRLVDAGNREVGSACGTRGLRAKGDMPGPPLRC